MFQMWTFLGVSVACPLSLPALLQPWVTPHGLSGPTHLLHLLLVAIGANALKGLLGVIGVPALLLICLLGLRVWRSMTGWGGGLRGVPRVRLPEPSLPSPCRGLWVEWGPPNQGQGSGGPE